MQTINQLKEKGYKVKITHYRPFLTNVPRCNKENLVIYLPKYFKDRYKHYTLISRGGWTTLEIFKDNKLIESVITICNDHDNFNYRAAVELSLKKLSAPELQ